MRWRASENCDEGNWAMALTRMLVTTSSLIRSGLSWYLVRRVDVSDGSNESIS